MKNLLIIVAFFAGLAHSLDCEDKATEYKILDASDAVKNWNQLIKYHEQYGACDKGDVAYTNMGMVERLFLDDWKGLWRVKPFEKSPEAWSFVLGHINDRWIFGSNHWFLQQLSFQCPEAYENICQEMKQKYESSKRTVTGSLPELESEPQATELDSEPQLETADNIWN